MMTEAEANQLVRRSRARLRFATAVCAWTLAVIAAWYLLGLRDWVTARLGPALATVAYLVALGPPAVASGVMALKARRPPAG